jgi:hypothetical protein
VQILTLRLEWHFERLWQKFDLLEQPLLKISTLRIGSQMVDCAKIFLEMYFYEKVGEPDKSA